MSCLLPPVRLRPACACAIERRGIDRSIDRNGIGSKLPVAGRIVFFWGVSASPRHRLGIASAWMASSWANGSESREPAVSHPVGAWERIEGRSANCPIDRTRLPACATARLRTHDRAVTGRIGVWRGAPSRWCGGQPAACGGVNRPLRRKGVSSLAKGM